MPRYTADDVDSAVAALSADPDRFKHASEVVTHAAPGLQRILNDALHAGGWFDAAHESQVEQVAASGDPAQLRTLIAEETRLGMLVGVAVGIELAHELERSD